MNFEGVGMDAKNKQLINETINEIQYIKRELERLSRELAGFKGIGTDICSRKLLDESKKLIRWLVN